MSNETSEQYFDEYRDAQRAHYYDGGFIITCDDGRFCVLDHEDIQKYRTPAQIKWLDERPCNWDEVIALEQPTYPKNDHLVYGAEDNVTYEQVVNWCARNGYKIVKDEE
jgi:hypothetical protein